MHKFRNLRGTTSKHTAAQAKTAAQQKPIASTKPPMSPHVAAARRRFDHLAKAGAGLAAFRTLVRQRRAVGPNDIGNDPNRGDDDGFRTPEELIDHLRETLPHLYPPKDSRKGGRR